MYLFLRGLLYYAPPFIAIFVPKGSPPLFHLHHQRIHTFKASLLGKWSFCDSFFFASQPIMVVTQASRSRAVGEAKTQVSSHRRVPPSPPRISQARTFQPAQIAHTGGDTISRLMPFLMSVQETQ